MTVINVKTECHNCKEWLLLKNTTSSYCKFCQHYMGRIDVFFCKKCYSNIKEEHDTIHHQSVDLV